MKRADGKEPPYMGEDKEYLVRYTKEYMKTHPNIDYFVYGHRHIELDLMLSRKVRMMILGDWISQPLLLLLMSLQWVVSLEQCHCV